MVDLLQTKTEIVVTEGDQDGRKIAEMVRQIGASTLVVGLHDHSFIYRYLLPPTGINIGNYQNLVKYEKSHLILLF